MFKYSQFGPTVKNCNLTNTILLKILFIMKDFQGPELTYFKQYSFLTQYQSKCFGKSKK